MAPLIWPTDPKDGIEYKHPLLHFQLSRRFCDDICETIISFLQEQKWNFFIELRTTKRDDFYLKLYLKFSKARSS
jgi:hypothetical protein